MEEKILNFYLLGEPRGTYLTSPVGDPTDVTEFFVIGYPGGEAIGIFISRLDAEICRLYLNRQNHDDRRNEYEMVGHKDRRVAIIKKSKIAIPPCHLISGFVADAKTRKLVLQGGCYSLMHAGLFADDQNWLLWGEEKPQRDILSFMQKSFAACGEDGYLEELRELDGLDGQNLMKLAQIAVLQIGVMTSGTPTIPVFFSPRREGWIELKN